MTASMRSSIYWFSAGSGFLFVLDQLLKYLAKNNPDFSVYLIKNYFGWEYFANLGIAFSIPVPISIVLIATPLFLLWLILSVLKEKHKDKFLALSLIAAGALSNFIDRMLFGYTIDYIRIFTAVINVADIMIFSGILMLLSQKGKK